MDNYGFYTGQIFDAHQYLGAHYNNGKCIFRTFAPAASGVCLIYGSNYREIPMNKVDGSFYEIELDDVNVGDTYEYRIYHHGTFTDHCDPYGYGMELRPAHRSIIRDLDSYEFHDSDWMTSRSNCYDKPLNIYELHAGSWKKPVDEPASWYNYVELGNELIPYLKENGYNYVEFMPLSEHPCDESWGYQNTGFFAPTSRYGTAEMLMELIDNLHQNGIGAILDFVPVHFAVDNYGLGNYDGTALYEYPNNDVGVSEWGSYNFMHSRGEVRTFLQSNASYWLSAYHFDGLRMDAISRIIYWQGDQRRGVNGNAVDFIKLMNRHLKETNPGCMLIAEDSTNYPNVTKNVNDGGLGFDYKWDMGWMHDTLDFFQATPAERSERYHKLTFSMMYYYNERYLLPLSHDEVVHGKATILQKMNGNYEGKFPQAKAMYMYMMLHPGKKLLFMGNEFGQLREWDEKRQQDWLLMEYPVHQQFAKYMKELNNIYLSYSGFFSKDFENAGFRWLDCHQEGRVIYAIEREDIIGIFNFNNYRQENYILNINGGNMGETTMCSTAVDKIELLFNSDWESFGGNTSDNECEYCYDKENCNLTISLEPFSGVLLKLG